MKRLVGVISCVWVSALLADYSYDYYLFELEWKPTNCKFMTCPSSYIGVDFNIHGLWPERSNGSYPESCSTVPYSLTSSSLEAEMNKYWESYTGDNPTFWQHEWSKHGTCVSPAESPETYFSSVINLYKKIDPKSLLATRGITPTNNTKYTTAEVKASFSKSVNISCGCKNSLCYLETLEICIDKSLGVIDCTSKTSNCGTELYYPIS